MNVLEVLWVCVLVKGSRRGLLMGVGCPCPPIRNDNVNPCHLFTALKNFMIVIRKKWQREKDVLHFFDLNKPAADGFWSLRVMKLRILF